MRNRLSKFIALSESEKIDYTSKKFKKAIERAMEENKQLIENSKPDRKIMHLTFS